MQHLLGRAKWDADQVRDDLREYAVEHLHDDQAVLVVDEIGDGKKGTGTVGVQRQYTGTAGRIENAQVAVYLVYAGQRGHAAVDRELYVSRSWTADPDRCRAAGLGGETTFATKPELAARMIARFLDAGHQAAWVTGDEVYGGNPKLRDALEKRGTGYILAVVCSHEVTTGAGKFRADILATKVPKRAWQKLSAGAGAKGRRFYDWAVVDLADRRPGSRQLLIRRNRGTGELAYYRCYSPTPVPLTTLVRVAGSRWRGEEYWGGSRAIIRINETRFGTGSVVGLEDFSHLEVVFRFHLTDPTDLHPEPRRPMDNPDWPAGGVFAHRNMRRLNWLGVSRCRLLNVDGLDLHVEDLDAVDGTPVLDIKPWFEEMGPRGKVHQPSWPTEMLADYYATPRDREQGSSRA